MIADHDTLETLEVGRLAPFLEARHLELAAHAYRWLQGRDFEAAEESTPAQLAGDLAGAGLLRACVPSAFGGLRERVELRDLCLVRMLLGFHSSLVDTVFAMQGLGSYPVTLAGSEKQRERLLPRVARGEAICAFALTEPDAGSDVSAVNTRAEDVDGGYRLSGTKTFISNAGCADSYVLFARTSSDAHRGLTAFLIDGNTPGLHVEPLELIAPHPIGTLRLDGLFVPSAARIGEEGEGFSLAMRTLDLFRPSVGAAAVGMGRRALSESCKRVRARRQFGKTLSQFQLTQAAIADMAVDLASAELLVFSAAAQADAGRPVGVDAAMAKLHATEVAQRVIDRAVQLHGGQGILRGAITERLYREIRALRIYEGTTEIQKLVIAKALLR
jgi:acyl-CoA dehydrogenase